MIKTKEFHFKRKEFNRVFKDLYKDFVKQQKKTKKTFDWDINPNAYTFFTFFNEKDNTIIKIYCTE